MLNWIVWNGTVFDTESALILTELELLELTEWLEVKNLFDN